MFWLRLSPGLEGSCRSIRGVVVQSKVGRAWGRMPAVVLAAKVCWCSFGNSFSKRLSVFGVRDGKQESKQIVVGLVGVVKSEVVIVTMKDKGVSYVIVSITLNVGSVPIVVVALLLENIQRMLLWVFWLWRT